MTTNNTPSAKRILRKEFDKIQEQRDNGYLLECLTYKAPNGLYYKVDGTGMAATKVMVDHLKIIKQGLKTQTSLL